MDRRQLGKAMLAVTWLIAAIVTLYPFRFSLEVASLDRIDWRVYYPRHNDRDLVLNLLMLMPLGTGLALVRCGRASIKRIALEAAGIGFGTALIIETLQIFESARFPQVADIWRNGVGCVVAAVIVSLVLNRARAR
jgi:glycopeptide antibiotics resistance protein